MNKNQINIAKSSIIGLQAELARKQDEAIRNLSQNKPKSSKLELKPHIIAQFSKVKEKKTIQPKSALEDLNAEVLQKARESLLAKSKLYDKLKNKELVTDDPDQFLVDFQKSDGNVAAEKREEEEDSDSDSEWVTFTDSLGRSRTCLRTDLKYYKKLDSNISTDVRIDREPSIEKEEPKRTIEQPSMMSNEMALWEQKREELRKQWEEEEKHLSEKRDIHYQDVLFNEARVHGVGYFQFSKDETERQKQQEELNKLREETIKNQSISMSIKERRQQQMKQRIQAAKKRKRVRLGLPPDAEEEEEELEKPEERKEKEEQESKEEMARKIEELLKDVERSRHVRPWDMCKDGVNPPVMSQEQWNEKQRSRRKKEFAPPSTYSTPSEPKETNGLYFSSKKGKRRGLGHAENKSVPIEAEFDVDEIDLPKKPKSDRKGAAIPPPSAYENDRLPGKLKKSDLHEAFEMGLNRQKQNSESKNKKKDQILSDIE